MLSTSFVAVPALSRVEPAMTSGPTAGRDGQVDERLELGAWIAGHEDHARARLTAAGERAAHERRHAAGRDADDDVLLRRLRRA